MLEACAYIIVVRFTVIINNTCTGCDIIVCYVCIVLVANFVILHLTLGYVYPEYQ